MAQMVLSRRRASAMIARGHGRLLSRKLLDAATALMAAP